MDIRPKHEPPRPQDQPAIPLSTYIQPNLNPPQNFINDLSYTYNNAVYNPTPGYTSDTVYTVNNNVVVCNDTVNNNIKPTEVKLIADISKRVEAYLKTFPAGYRFNPSDVELILFYLKRKVENKSLPPNKIWSVDLYLYHPKDLIRSISAGAATENAWYFFTSRSRKYPNGTRPNRAVGKDGKEGYWKATGADKAIEHGAEKTIVGYRKALVFYVGSPPNGAKTNWIMHEYRVNQPPRSRINADDMKLDDWVLCKLHKKVDRSVKIARVVKPAWDDGEPQLGIVDDANLLPPDDNNLNPNINIVDDNNLIHNDYVDSNVLVFHPPTYWSQIGADNPFFAMIDPQFTNNQNALQNGHGLWNNTNKRTTDQ